MIQYPTCDSCSWWLKINCRLTHLSMNEQYDMPNIYSITLMTLPCPHTQHPLKTDHNKLHPYKCGTDIAKGLCYSINHG